MFTILCDECSAKAKYNPDKFGGVVDIMFEQGSLNIMDRMIIFCRKCGNKQKCGIEWPLNLHNYNQPLESDRANPCAHEVWVTCGDKVVCENCRQIMKPGG